MAWVAIGSTVAGAVISNVMAPSPGSPTSATGAAAASDPFAGQRPQYQQQLSDMMKPGATFGAQDPSYNWRFNQGLMGLNRSNAASGRMASGNEMAAATEYGQNMASTEYGNQFNRLSKLAGGDIGSPAQAGQILYGAGQQQQQGATAIGNAVGTGVANWFNTPTASTPSYNAAPGSFDTGSSSQMQSGGVQQSSWWGA